MSQESIQAFIDGYNYGIDYKEELSMRDMEEKFPWYGIEESECFLNGLSDGLRKDEFRIRQMESIITRKQGNP